MHHEGDKHRCRIKQHISDEGTDPAYEKGTERIQQNSSRDNDHIIEIHMAAGHRNAQHAGAHNNIHGHQQCRNRHFTNRKPVFIHQNHSSL